MKDKLNKLIGRRVIDIAFEFGRTGEIINWNEDYIEILLDGETESSYFLKGEYYLYDSRAMINSNI